MAIPKVFKYINQRNPNEILIQIRNKTENCLNIKTENCLNTKIA